MPIMILVVSSLSYGVLLPYLGIYWDDLPSFWFYHIGGKDIFLDVFSSDRPFLWVLFQATLSIF